jgi:hypothetical protein
MSLRTLEIRVLPKNPIGPLVGPQGAGLIGPQGDEGMLLQTFKTLKHFQASAVPPEQASPPPSLSLHFLLLSF